ncbi:uncharacterized protein LOC143174606 [Nomia melanderi]|uniref:uncharacterized protein LOC143174606 n=1 Tax=Nomia melanderi TaxID=2448451 RepID=UPI003FCE756B
MFWQSNSFFYHLTRSYPFFRHIDIYDPDSFIRQHVFDYGLIIFVLIIWFATYELKMLERSNKQKQKILKKSKAFQQHEDVSVLKDKKAEYEESVIKVKQAQRATTANFDVKLQKLDTKLSTVMKEIAALNENVHKLISSSRIRGGCSKVLRATLATEKPNCRRLAARPCRSRISRFWSRPSHHLYLHHGNMGSLSVDRLGNVVRLPRLQMQLCQPKSDSSNYASVEASSESAIRRHTNKMNWTRYSRRDVSRRGRGRRKLNDTRFDGRRLRSESLRNISSFTKSLLGLATIFSREK